MVGHWSHWSCWRWFSGDFLRLGLGQIWIQRSLMVVLLVLLVRDNCPLLFIIGWSCSLLGIFRLLVLVINNSCSSFLILLGSLFLVLFLLSSSSCCRSRRRR